MAHIRQLSDGRRQMVQLLLPGDAITPFLSGGSRQEIVCITPVHAVDGEAIRAAGRDPAVYPGIAAAIAMAATLDRALLMEQIVRLGRQSAYERMASLFVELHRRLSAVGLANGDDIPLPLTQEMLGDLLGLSVVHVNRTLQLMRREGLIELAQGRLKLLDLAVLTGIAAS